jgi:thiamine-phosphate pyrophosphorylase
VPRLFLITDRRLCADIPARVDEILALAPTRSVAVQIREKDLDGRELLALTRAVMETGVETWVNDRVDVALAAGAHGVHLPEHGMSIAEARALGIAKIGVSRHTREAVLAADADLVQYGPIFDTPGKGSALGLDALAVRRELPSKIALVAVGGFETREQARHAAAGGADAVAVIRAAWLKPAKFVAEMVDAVEAGVAMRYAPM